ncbi:MAG: peptidoglycan editing factor PgeF [Chloroflexota bacterium]|nr:peptidoglycan editing factor PgeF [Chloroflexota bacterium]
MQRIQHGALAYYRSESFDGLRHGIFTRLGGTSATPFDSLNVGGNIGDDPASVRANHLSMWDALAVDDARVCTVWQVHGADVIAAVAPDPDRRWLAKADALITDQRDLPLSMRFADCTPILLYDPRRRAIGIVHAGWRGTVQGVASAAVQAMQTHYGVDPADLRALIGPSISVDRYQVGQEVVDAVYAQFATLDGLVKIDPDDGSAWFDLWAANRLDLERVGVRQIEIAGLCTAARTDEFFSHRAEGGRTGRFGAMICL